MIGRGPAATEPPTACDIGPVGKGSLSWAIMAVLRAWALLMFGGGKAASLRQPPATPLQLVEYSWSDTELQWLTTVRRPVSALFPLERP